MTVTIVSLFRNHTAKLPKYLEQVANLGFTLALCGMELTASWVYGDSTDDTAAKLHAAAEGLMATRLLTEVQITEHHHGGPVWGSVENADRMKALTGVLHAGLGGVPARADLIFYVESDLRWTPETVLALIRQVGGEVSIVAPLILQGDRFYDIWGFRGLNGTRFEAKRPYHPSLTGLTEVSSVGSAFVARSLTRYARAQDDQALVGWCANARQTCGARIFVDPTLTVEHP